MSLGGIKRLPFFRIIFVAIASYAAYLSVASFVAYVDINADLNRAKAGPYVLGEIDFNHEGVHTFRFEQLSQFNHGDTIYIETQAFQGCEEAEVFLEGLKYDLVVEHNGEVVYEYQSIGFSPSSTFRLRNLLEVRLPLANFFSPPKGEYDLIFKVTSPMSVAWQDKYILGINYDICGCESLFLIITMAVWVVFGLVSIAILLWVFLYTKRKAKRQL